jgi:hypothetical protein
VSSFIRAFTPAAKSRAALNDRINRVGQAHRRRIDDLIEEAFQHACLSGDMDTAAELVALLERKYDRWMAAHGTDRRAGDQRLSRMRDELSRRERVKIAGAASRPAGPKPERD